MEFGRQMKVLRTAKGLDLADMAMITAIDEGALSRYERGMQIPERHMNAILIGYGFPPEPLRGIAFGILEGNVDEAGLVDKLLSAKLVEAPR